MIMKGIHGYDTFTGKHTAHITINGVQVASVKGNKRDIEDFKRENNYVTWYHEYEFAL